MSVPAPLLRGRQIGSDFVVKDGFRMYHGESVPGFPAHPHRGFETVTIVTEGTVDHHDSLGATARFGGGGSDTQWVTTGRGIQHSEMMPLVNSDKPNHLELFQIWLNLRSTEKFCNPHFTMLWSERNPVVRGAGYAVTVLCDQSRVLVNNAQPPPPESWASQAGADVAIWLIDVEPAGEWVIPAAATGAAVNRNVYVFEGAGGALLDQTQTLPHLHGAKLNPAVAVSVRNPGATRVRMLLLQGRPIGEPVVQRGPFVLNTEAELMQAYADFQKTSFGGWPWPRSDPAHPKEQKRFARHVDGRVEYPDELVKLQHEQKHEL